MAHCRIVWTFGWRALYRQVVRSSFATVPFYRERWALRGRTDPVVVAGRTGEHGGAIPAAALAGRLPDLVPLAGGSATPDPLRGLEIVLPQCARVAPDTLIIGVAPEHHPLSVPFESTPDEPRGHVLAVGTRAQLAGVGPAVPRVELVPFAERGTSGLLVDELLGVLGGARDCGHWHLDWPRVYARETPLGLAFTLLRQRSPRLVDIVPAGGADGRIIRCPQHRTPVVVA
ncbi:hypothetical protein LV79_006628 [Actinokineospora globicatena]|nr:hypothetical protein [Actinokineospora globicatena]GLW82338.1 hypothetical protein Aglo01_68190 [Actinokineospora globicatena]GLW89069.1 hypothetical protein Aglo02_67080 [Actinokineospora globicatena]